MQRDGIIDGAVSTSTSDSDSDSEEYRLIRDSEARQLFKSSQNTLFQEERIEVMLKHKYPLIVSSLSIYVPMMCVIGSEREASSDAAAEREQLSPGQQEKSRNIQ